MLGSPLSPVSVDPASYATAKGLAASGGYRGGQASTTTGEGVGCRGKSGGGGGGRGGRASGIVRRIHGNGEGDRPPDRRAGVFLARGKRRASLLRVRTGPSTSRLSHLSRLLQLLIFAVRWYLRGLARAVGRHVAVEPPLKPPETMITA